MEPKEPVAVLGGVEAAETPLDVTVPRLELAQPQVDRVLMTRLASETSGSIVNLADAQASLPGLIPSAAKIFPLQTDEPLWNAPLAMVIFVMLIVGEWVIRKAYGML